MDTSSLWGIKQYIVGQRSDAPNILDVGAFHGNFAAKYREMFPRAKVYCLDPMPEAVEFMKERFTKESRAVKVYQVAVWDSVGEREFFVGGRKGNMSSLCPRPLDGRRYYQNLLFPAGKVKTVTVDKFLSDRKVSRVNILKADIHGAELRMIEGAKRALGRQIIDIVYMEVSFIRRYRDSPLYHEIASRMADFGYSLHSLHGFGSSKKNGQLSWADALFVSQDIRSSVIDAFPNE
jgi:FkbM family methyltransferase